jgi:hypothetical protein
VERIRDFAAPETRKQLQVFLGLSGYYRRFIRRYGEMAALEWLAAAKTGRLARWALRLAEYQSFEIVYRPGGEHRNVDAFIRVLAASEGLPDRAFVAAIGVETADRALPQRDALVEAQWSDPTLRRLLERGAIEFRGGVMGRARDGDPGCRQRWPWGCSSGCTRARLGRLHALLAARYAGVRARDVQRVVWRCDPCRLRK